MKSHPTELTSIGKYQRALRLEQYKVVILARLKIGPLNMRFASHSQMDAEILILGKSEKHLFPMTLRTNQGFADDAFAQGSFVQIAQHVFARVQPNGRDLGSATGIPLIAIPLDF